MNKRKLTNDEKRDWLLENCVNKNGNLVISDIDLSKFKGNVILSGWKIGGNADLSFWEVKGDLDQSCQKVNGDLDQSCQTAENITQHCQNVSKDLVSQKLKEDEEWVSFQGSDYAVIRAKKLKEISKDELAEMGYKLKEK